MGRYYSGDIEGKFWFAIQDSNAADRFGSTGYQPQYIEYSFYEEDLDSVKQEIANIENSLGDKKKKIEEFLSKNGRWSDRELAERGFTRDDLRDYADLQLGIKIRDCIEATGQCVFDAGF